MKRDIGIAQALLALRPGDGFAIRDENYAGIEWYAAVTAHCAPLVPPTPYQLVPQLSVNQAHKAG